jgi:hypothetical protein
VIEEVRKAAARASGTCEVIDVLEKPKYAVRYRQFCPFLILINNSIRLSSPMSADELVKIAREGIEAKATMLQTLGPEAQAETVEPLTIENLTDTCVICNWRRDSLEYQAKLTWVSQVKEGVPDGIVGFIAYEKGKAVSFVEFFPSPLIPYPLPEKNAKLSVINCLYPLEDGPDYRNQVLRRLIDYLPQQGYEKVQVIAGRRTLTPNGPVPFFLAHGFKEVKEVDKLLLKRGVEELVLMEKAL